MNDMEGPARPAIAPPEEDPNATITCSSPPCFMHELDPSWLGYLGRDELSALLGELLAAEWSGTVLETAWLRAMLRRHLARLGAAPPPEPQCPAPARSPPSDDETHAGGRDRRERLARRLRAALPRLHDDALRSDLRDLLVIMEHELGRPHGPYPA